MSRHESTTQLAKAHLAKQAADQAAVDATQELRGLERTLFLPLGEAFTVQINDKFITVTRITYDGGNQYSYLVSTPVEPR